ncbi:hypothetical protein [Phenylobacterium sp.]|jgi:hypothetical protein|uniref:hypothetical protein n=1 Tax=Phenylobacterium sp. TaxID=1871053 RepID=UPI002E30E117|nr:hypothetical protein [Phenylobacterium sp.]HEX2559315.1 hypothetical protein [Phenylobacterium sp.]
MTFIRRVLFADAVASLGSAVLLIAATGPVAELTGLSKAVLFEAGLVLVPFVLLVLAVAARPQISRAAVKVIIAINVLWVIGSVAVLAMSAPTALGYAFVIAQALAVGVLAELQVIGLKRAARTA